MLFTRRKNLLPLSRCCFALEKLDEWCSSCIKITQIPAFKMKSQNCRRYFPPTWPWGGDRWLPAMQTFMGRMPDREGGTSHSRALVRRETSAASSCWDLGERVVSCLAALSAGFRDLQSARRTSLVVGPRMVLFVRMAHQANVLSYSKNKALGTSSSPMFLRFSGMKSFLFLQSFSSWKLSTSYLSGRLWWSMKTA